MFEVICDGIPVDICCGLLKSRSLKFNIVTTVNTLNGFSTIGLLAVTSSLVSICQAIRFFYHPGKILVIVKFRNTNTGPFSFFCSLNHAT